LAYAPTLGEKISLCGIPKILFSNELSITRKFSSSATLSKILIPEMHQIGAICRSLCAANHILENWTKLWKKLPYFYDTKNILC